MPVKRALMGGRRVKSVLYALAVTLSLVGVFFEFFDVRVGSFITVVAREEPNTITGTCSLLFGLLVFLIGLLEKEEARAR